MNGIVRFACGCVGIILPTVQQQSRGEGYGFDNALVLKRCDTDYDEPSFGLSFRLLEQDKVDGAIALTAEEVKGLACDLQDLVAKGHAYYRIRALPGVK